MMRSVFGQPAVLDQVSENFFVPKDGDALSPCTWRGLRCESNFVTEIVSVVSECSERVSVEWLPSVLSLIHLKSLFLNTGFQTRFLPRDLKYFYADACNRVNKVLLKLDFRTLPTKLEEFHFLRSFLDGKVYPESTRTH